MLRDWATPRGEAPRTTDERDGAVRAEWRREELSALAARLAERGAAALAGVPLERRLAVWNEVVRALLEPGSAERDALFAPLVVSSRLSPEGLSEALEVVVGGAGADAAADLAARAVPAEEPGYDAVVLASNVPGLAVQSLLPALVVGRPLLLRSSRREPLFAPALVAALAAREAALAEAFVALSWPSEDRQLASAAFDGARRLLAYGAEKALAALADRFGDRLTTLGPRASVAFVAGAIDELAVGRALARDVALLDQRGCLSVQAVYVVGDADALASALAFGLAFEQRRLPPGPADPSAAARVQQIRGSAELAERLIGDLPTAAGTVVLTEDPGFTPSPGLRCVRVHAAASLDEALRALAPWRGRLQGAALAGAEAKARGDEIAVRLGLARVAEAGTLQSAAAGWTSGGVDPLSVFS